MRIGDSIQAYSSIREYEGGDAMSRARFTVSVVLFFLSLTTIGKAQTISDATISNLLVQFTSTDWTVRKDAFYALVNLGTNVPATSYSVPPKLLSVLQNVSTGSADQINLGLIALLVLENDNIAPSYEPADIPSLLTEDYTDYYADVIAAVATLKDPRSISSLVGALRSGDMATRSLAAFGDAAIDALTQQLASTDDLVQFSFVFAMKEMLDLNNFPNISAATKAKLRQAFAQASQSSDPETASEASHALATLNSLSGTGGGASDSEVYKRGGADGPGALFGCLCLG